MAEKWTPDSVARVLMDPGHVLVQPPTVDEDTWIEANTKLIEKMGADTYLATLLSVLRGDKM